MGEISYQWLFFSNFQQIASRFVPRGRNDGVSWLRGGGRQNGMVVND